MTGTGTDRAYLNGGQLPPGVTSAVNRTGQPETIRHPRAPRLGTLRARLILINVPHDPARHRRWRRVMRFHGARGIAVCIGGRIRGIALGPKFRGV